MTMTNCVRGCRRPCTCPECFADAVHDPSPAEATHGLLCRRCAQTLERWTKEIPDLYATLDARPGSVEQNSESKRLKVSGSPALARLDVIALADHRTMPHTGAPDQYGYTQDDDGILDVAAVVVQWSDILADDLELEGRADNISTAMDMLCRWWVTVTAMPWIDEMFTAFKEVRRMLGRAHGEQKPRPIGRCIAIREQINPDDPKAPRYAECRNTLYAPESGDRVRCRECGRTYRGLDMVRLKVANER